MIYTVFLGVKDRRDRHKRIAPKVLPVWIYVLATGVGLLVLWPDEDVPGFVASI